MDLEGRTLGSYQVVSKLGEGGMAVVYEAYDGTRGENVAVKVLAVRAADADAATRRFEREVEVIRRLRHPHILPLYDAGSVDGHSYFVMPLVAGGTIEEQLTGEPIELARAARWVAEIADALDHAHARGIVHRDLKPANVLLDEQDRALLSDFGIAKVSSAVTPLTSTGAVFGTPFYMSPEQVMGRDDVGPLSDVYSLGIVAYQLLTGQVPFTADTPMAIGLKHLKETPRPVIEHNPSLPPAMQTVLSRALAKEASGRFAGAGDFADSFTEAAEVSSRALVTLRPVRPAPPVVRARKAAPTTRRQRTQQIDVSRERRGAPNLLLWGLGSAAVAGLTMLPFVFAMSGDPKPTVAIPAPAAAPPVRTGAAVVAEVAVAPEPPPTFRAAPAPPAPAPPPPQPTQEQVRDMWLEQSQAAESDGDLPRAHHGATMALAAMPEDSGAKRRVNELEQKLEQARRARGFGPPPGGGAPPHGSGPPPGGGRGGPPPARR